MSKTTESEIKAGERTQCLICCQSPSNPFRSFDECGKAVMGCVDDCHTGHLIDISESSRWHNRTEAKAIRRNLKNLRRAIPRNLE